MRKIYGKQLEMFDDHKLKKFCIAFEKQYTGDDGVINYIHNFFHLNTLNEVKQELNTDKHLYEILTDKNWKLVFDFDYKNKELTRDEVTKFVNDLKETIETELHISIHEDDYIVLCNENKNKCGEKTDKIHSLHIIVSSYTMEFQEQKLFAEHLADKCNIDTDISIYNKNRKFRMLGQSKMKYGIKLVNFFSGNLDIKKTLINYKSSSKKDKIQHIKYKKDYLKENTNNKEVVEILQGEIMFLLLNGSEGDCKFDQKTFFNDNYDWKMVTKIIHKLKLYDLKEWAKVSVLIAENSNYTYEKNMKYINEITEINSGICKFYKIINKYTTHFVINIVQDLQPYMLDYLHTKYNENEVNYILQKIQTQDTTKQTNKDNEIVNVKITNYIVLDKNNKNTIVNINKGFITDENNVVTNMYYDNIPPRHETMFKELNNIQECNTITKQWLENNIKLCVIKSRWGSGKTSNIIFEILNTLKDQRILLITENNSLNLKLKTDFEEFGFVSHLDAQKDKTIKLADYPRVVCSIQSIGTIKHNTYDMIIIDEFESVCMSYTATNTFKGITPQRAFLDLLNLIDNSIKTICLDADISEDKVEMLMKRYGKEQIEIYKNKQLVFDNMKVKIITNKEHNVTLICDKLLTENKLICVPSASKKIVEYIIQHMTNTHKDKFKDKNILYVRDAGVTIYAHEKMQNFEKNETLEDIETFINTHNIHLFLYTPTIKTGISINNAYFNKTMGFSSRRSIPYNEFIQMLMRCRKLQDNEIYVFLETFTKFYYPITIDRTNRTYEQQASLIRTFMKDYEIYPQDEVNETYFELQMINNRNIYTSFKNYTYMFIQLLKYHHLNYEYVLNMTYNEQIEEFNLKESKARYEDVEWKKWINIPLMDYTQYFSIYKLKDTQERFNEMTEDQIQSYKKTNTIYGMYNINNRLNKLFNDTYLDVKRDNVKWKYKEYSKYRYYDEDGTIVPIHALQQEQIENIIEDWLGDYNGGLFFQRYILDGKVSNVYKILGLKHTKEQIITYTKNDKMQILEDYIYKFILKMFEIYNFSEERFIPRQITNKQFKDYIKNNIEMVEQIFQSVIIGKPLKFNIQQHCKTFYHFVKQTLLLLDIELKYVSQKNTTHESNLMEFERMDGFYLHKQQIERRPTTLDAFKNEHIKIAPKTILELKKLNSILKRKKTTLEEKEKARDTLLLNEGSYKENEYYFNELLEPIHKKDIKQIVGKYCLVKNRKRIPLYEYKNGKGNTIFRAYKATEPIINTLKIANFEKTIDINELEEEYHTRNVYMKNICRKTQKIRPNGKEFGRHINK